VTKDGVSVVIKAQIKYEIEDLSVFAVKVYDAIDAISDMTCGIIFQTIKNKTYQEACTSDLNKLITSGAKREAKQWGINIEKITVTDFSQMRSIRLFNENSNLS
jgi:regulator of protease activity HflC (stomatin/prohibitin superfamily)